MAMKGELSQVESPWAGTLWALGGTSVMVKQTLISLVVPNSLVPDGGLFAKSPALRRAATAVSAACILAALLFFAAPPFRQAFQVAMKPWLATFHASAADPQRAFEALARKAEIRQDAEGLAFCAIRVTNPQEGARLAKAAVRLDPKLLWIYAVLAMRAPGSPETVAAVEQLERLDPQNGLFHIILAESVVQRMQRAHPGSVKKRLFEDAWLDEMTAAFHSTNFDDYSSLVAQLNRTVVPRYRLYDPYEVETREGPPPQFLLANTQKFAQSLLQEGESFEARADHKSAHEQYWTVARFGQVLDSEAHTAFEHAMGTSLQSLAYRRLEKSAAQEGDQQQAILFGYLADKFDGAGGKAVEQSKGAGFGQETALRNAAVVEVSGLMFVVFLLLGAIAAVIIIVGSRRSASVVALRAKPVAVIVLLTSALGALFSSVTLYLTYRPYWYIFHSAVLDGDGLQTSDLQEFLGSMQALPGTPHRANALLNALFYSGSPGFLFYVWAGVTLLGVIGLALILLRHFLGQSRASPPTKRRP